MDFQNGAQFRYIHDALLLKPTALFVLLTTLISAFKLIVQPMVMTQGGPLNSNNHYGILHLSTRFQLTVLLVTQVRLP